MYQYIWYMIYIETVVHFFGKYLSWHLTVDWIISWKQNWRKQRGCVFLWKKIKNDLDSLVVWNLYQAQQMQMQRRQVVLQLNKFWQIHFPIPSNSNTNQQIHTHVTLAITIPNSLKYQKQTPKYSCDIGKYISQFPQIPNPNPQIHMWHWQIHFPIPPITKHKPPNTYVRLANTFPNSPNINQIQTNNYTCHIGNYNSLFFKYHKHNPQINYTWQSKDYNERKLSDIEFIWTNVALYTLLVEA